MKSGRSVWITGASSGIGRALAVSFVNHGDDVLATARNAGKLESLRDDIPAGKGRLTVSACDVRDPLQVQRVAQDAVTTYGTLDLLVNNAGVTSFKDFASTSVEEFDDIIATNLRGLFLTTKAVLPTMLRNGRGTIMNILSFAGKVVYTGSSAYAASKAGAEALMNVVRAETRDKGIKIVNVYPGAVLTPIWHPKHQERYRERMVKPEEIAEAVFAISCQPDSMMTEEVILRPQGGDLRV